MRAEQQRRQRVNAAGSGSGGGGGGASAHSQPPSPQPPQQQPPQQQQQPQRPRSILGLREIAPEFDGVLLDQFGVLHDGRTPVPSAVEAVRRLAAAGKQVVIVSNSSRRSGGTISKLVKMGFEASWFTGAITSGELTHRYLEARPDPWWRALGRRCIHITWSSRGAICLDGLGLELVSSPEDDDPDFILAHGTEAVALPPGQAGGGGAAAARDAGLNELRALVERCAAAAKRRGRAMPMVVANPDIVTVDGAGGLIVMPGTLADWYSKAGGEVRVMGKPGPLIYEAAAQIAPGVARGRWLAVGDSLQHDVAGCLAAGAGPALFIASGIHAEELGLETGGGGGGGGGGWDAAALARLCEEHGAVPTYASAWLEW